MKPGDTPDSSPPDMAALQAELEALRAERDELRQLVTLGADYVFSYEVDSGSGEVADHQWLGDVFEQLFGTRPTGLADRETLRQLIDPEDLPCLRQAHEDALAGRPGHCEFRVISPDGDVRWLRGVWQVRPVAGEAGRLRLYGSGHDVTALKQAEEEQRQQRLVAEALRQTAEALARSLELDDVLDRILLSLARVMPHDAANIMLVEDGQARVVRHRGYEGHGNTIDVGELVFDIATTAPMQDVVRTGEVWLVADTASADDWQPQPGIEWIRSHVAVPIRLEGEVIGLLNLDSATPHAFVGTQLEFLQSFADQAASAVRNARLYDQLRRQEARHRALLDVIPDLVFELTRDGVFVDFHNAEMGLWLPAQEFLGKPIHDVMPDLAAQAMERVERAFETGEVQQFRYQLPVGDELHEYEARIVGREDGRAVVIVRDVTDWVRAEARQRAILQAIPDLMFVVDREGYFRGYEASGREQWLAMPPDQIVGSRITDIATSPQNQSGLAIIQRVLETGQPERTEYQLDLPEYGTRDFEARFVPSGPGEVLIIARDMTDLKQSERDLRASEERYRTIVEDQTELIFRCDPAGTITFVNNAFCRFFDVSADRVLNRSIFALSAPDDVPRMRARFARLSPDNPTLVTHREYAGEDGPRFVDWTLRGIFDAEGAITEFQAVGRDVTAQKQADEQRLQLAVEQERVRVLAHFIESVSHEFATPLAVIHSGLEVLERVVQLDEVAASRVHRLKEQALYIGEMVEGMLTLTHLDTAPELRRSSHDINALVEELSQSMQKYTAGKRVTFVHELAADLPEVSCDRYLLRQALHNLCRNAVEALDIEGTVTLQTARDGDHVVVAVRDTGTGISAEHLPHIFDRFYRVNQARTGRHAGLGLSIAQRIVELHGGQIEVESTPGSGSTFRVRLPLAEAEPAEDQA